MASNRYGRIYHNGDVHHINLRFPSVDARRAYSEKFQEYHAGHEHDGAVPRFEEITAKDMGGFNVYDIPEADTVSIDGYHAYEIEKYHEREDDRYVNYSPPTCCVPPLISIQRQFVESSTLTRHELSAVFGDMPADDYQSLLESIQRDGVMDEVIRLVGDEVLDGWHRYRAAKELNLIRKLRFQQWDPREDHDGDPAAFVLARNIERRHLAAAQRAQIAVIFNERFGHGGDRKSEGEIKSPNGGLKTRQELAKEASVGTSTIDRAVKVEKIGKSEAVITGEKSASEVLLESNRTKAQDANIEMWNAFEKSDLSKYLDKDDLQEVASKALQCPRNFPDPMQMKRPEIWVCWFGAITRTLEQESGWVKELLDKFREDERLENEPDDEKAEALEKFQTQKRDVYDQIRDTPPLLEWKDEFGNINSDKALNRVMLAAYKNYGLDESLLWSDQAIQELSADEIRKLTSEYYLIARDFDVPFGEWVRTLLDECEAAEPELFSDTQSNPTVTRVEADQMVRDYPTLENPTAEPESDKQDPDPDPDEWDDKWSPQLVDVFEGHGVKYVNVVVDDAVIGDYGSLPWKLSVEDFKRLISDAKTVIAHAKTPKAWKRNDGTEGILWALKVLGLDQEDVSESDTEGDIGELPPIVSVGCWYLEDGQQKIATSILASKLSKRTIQELWHYMQKPHLPFDGEG